MPMELTDAKITHVSYVDKAANQKRFFLTKAAEQEVPNIEKTVKLLVKADEAEQLVYGVVYEPGVEDSQGDFMKASEIEKAAHGFLADARNIDTQHDFNAGVGTVVESYVAPADFTIGTETITKGTWVLVTKASNEVWESIQKGDITGYSLAGTAQKTETDTVSKAESDEKSFFNLVKAFFTKGEVKDTFYENRMKQDFRTAFWIFDDIFWDEVWSSKPDVQKIADAAKDFGELLVELSNSPDILKSLEEIKKEEPITMKKEDLQALLKAELAPLTERLTALEKQEGDPIDPVADPVEPEVTPDPTEELKKSLVEVLKAELAPLTERLDAVEKARKTSNQPESTTETVEKADEPGLFDGLFRC